METIIKHVKLHRALYILLPLFIIATLAAIRGYFFLTGRPPTDDPGVLVGFAYNSIRIVLAIAFAAIVKGHAQLNRPTATREEDAVKPHGDLVIHDWKELLISRAYTGFLIWLFAHILAN